MRFTKAVDIWTADPRTLQPGQWVFAGTDDGPGSPTRGRFFGIRSTGSLVVAWMGNARSSRNVRSYLKSLHTYARG